MEINLRASFGINGKRSRTIKNLKRAARRIEKAVKNKEKIILFGDSDLDGVASIIILKETIDNLVSLLSKKSKRLFPPIETYFPDRKKEGYGLNEQALFYLKKKVSPPALLISLDCGISNFEEVDLAKKFGFNVIIIDHHQVLKKIPSADIVVDPKQKGDTYPFKEFSNAGLTFKLSQEILKELLSPALRMSFLELAALATIADMMPEIEENKILILEGLNNLEKSQRPGIKAFFSILNLKEFSSRRELISKIISALNVAPIENHQHQSFLLLTAANPHQAIKLARNLRQRSKFHQIEIRALEENLKDLISKKEPLPIIFEGSENWQLELLGSVASRICRDFKKPVFLFQISLEWSRGTVRVLKGQNAVKAMESCGKLFKTFGGHPLAAGFCLENKNLEKFKECLIKYFR